jgi:hypothetical protein
MIVLLGSEVMRAPISAIYQYLVLDNMKHAVGSRFGGDKGALTGVQEFQLKDFNESKTRAEEETNKIIKDLENVKLEDRKKSLIQLLESDNFSRTNFLEKDIAFLAENLGSPKGDPEEIKNKKDALTNSLKFKKINLELLKKREKPSGDKKVTEQTAETVPDSQMNSQSEKDLIKRTIIELGSTVNSIRGQIKELETLEKTATNRKIARQRFANMLSMKYRTKNPTNFPEDHRTFVSAPFGSEPYMKKIQTFVTKKDKSNLVNPIVVKAKDDEFVLPPASQFVNLVKNLFESLVGKKKSSLNIYERGEKIIGKFKQI